MIADSRFPLSSRVSRTLLVMVVVALGLVVAVGTLGLLQSPSLAAPAEELGAAPVPEVSEHAVASAAREEIPEAAGLSSVLPARFAESGGYLTALQGTIGECMVARYNATKPASATSLNCTANDVTLAAWELISGPTTCIPGEVISVVVKGEFVAGAGERYDVGVFIATDGGSANSLGGQCYQDFLEPVSENNTDLDLTGGFGPYYNAEITEDAGDLCGDIRQDEATFDTFSTVSIVCEDSDNNNVADVSTCTVWANSKSDGSENKPSCIDESDVTAETTAKCTCGPIAITNLIVPETAIIEVVKYLPSEEGLFNLQIDGVDEAKDVGDLGRTGPITVSAGTVADPGEDHTVGETAGTDTSLADYDSSIECVDRGKDTFNGGSPLTFTGPGPLTVPVDPDDDIVCTITNVQEGHIVVDKVTDPSGDDQAFTFGPSWGSNFSLTDAGTPVDSGALSSGTYSVTETVPAGWDLTAIMCDDESGDSTSTTNPTDETATIALGPGETVTCTFTNTKRGSIVVEKQTLPDGDTSAFEFTGDLTDTLADGGTSSEDVEPGTYAVSETVPAGWDLTAIVCDDDDSSGDLGNRAATFEVDPGETVTCVFTNTKKGSIVVDKVTDPSGDDQAFTFEPSWGSNFSLTDAGTPVDSGALSSGTYSVTETVPAGWELTAIMCDDESGDSTSTTSPTDETATVALGPGEYVTCTFTNIKPSITIDKSGDGLSKQGDDVTYSFTITNTGAITLYKELIDDTVLGDITDDTGLDASISNYSSTCAASLGPDEWCTITLSYTIPGDASDPLTNVVSATYNSESGFAGVAVSSSDDHSVQLFGPSVQVEKTGPAHSKVGDEITYTVTISNTSSADAPDLMLDAIDDSLVGDLEAVATDNGCGTLGSDPPESCTFTYTYTVQSGDLDPLTNTVEVHYHPEGFENDVSDWDDHKVGLFDPFEFEKTGDPLSKVGDPVNYTLTLSNTTVGGLPDLECRITDTMLGIDEILILAPGESDEINRTYTVPSDASDPLINTAEVSCSPVGSPSIDEGSASHTVNLFQPAVQVVKSGDTTAMLGDTVVYDFNITNIGSSDSPSLTLESVQDSLLGDLTSVAAANGCNTLGYQASCAFEVSRDVVQGDPNPLTNTVTVLYHPMGFENDVVDDDYHEVHLTEQVVGGATVPLSWTVLIAPWMRLTALTALLLLGATAVVWRPGTRKQ